MDLPLYVTWCFSLATFNMLSLLCSVCVCICVSYAVECIGMYVWHVHVCMCKLCVYWGICICVEVCMYVCIEIFVCVEVCELYAFECAGMCVVHVCIEVFVCVAVCVWGHSCEVLVYMHMWKAEQDTECCPLLPSALLPWDRVFHWTRSSPLSSQDLRISSSQHWCYRYTWPCPDFKWVLGIWTHAEEALLPPGLALQPQYTFITLHIE